MLDINKKNNRVDIYTKRNRIAWLDIAKLVAIYFVIYGHTLQYLQKGIDPHYNYMWMFVYSFHMPLFMLISGYFSYSVLREDFLTLFKKKTMQLIVPCVLWGCIWYVLKILFVYNGMIDIVNHMSPDIEWLIMDILWFLKSLFICILLCYIFKRNIWLLILSLMLSQIMPYKLPLMYPCFLVGLLCRRRDFFTILNNKWTVIIVVLFVVLYIFFEQRHMQTNLRETAKGLLLGEYKLFLIELWNRIYCLIVGIAGSLSVVSLCKSISQVIMKNNFANRITEFGSQTQAVYILHGPIMVYGIAYFINLNSVDINWYNNFICPVIALMLLILCLFLINLCTPNVRKVLFGSRN